MWKYIAKRLLLCLVILLGVSVIIYTLVRLMPTDYIDKKFQSQIQQGTVLQSDVDRVKELYGLYVPHSRVKLTFDSKTRKAFGISTITMPLNEKDWVYKQNFVSYVDGDGNDITLEEAEKSAKTAYPVYNADYYISQVINVEADGTEKPEPKDYHNGDYTLNLNEDILKGYHYSLTKSFMVFKNADKMEFYADDGGVYIVRADDSGRYHKIYISEFLGDADTNKPYLYTLKADNSQFFYETGEGANLQKHVVASTVSDTYGSHTPATRKQVVTFDESSYSYGATNYPTIISQGTYRYSSETQSLVFDDGTEEYRTKSIKSYILNGGHKFGCILDGYFSWLGNFCKGDLGESFKFNQPVEDVIKKDMWISFSISFIALILQFAIAIPLGILSATHQYGALDYTVTILAMMGISLPSFFMGKMLIAVFAEKLKWFPVSGWIDTNMAVDASSWEVFWSHVHHGVLPMLVLVILSIGGLMRYTRTNMLEVLNADYIRTARAKGLSERTVIYKHAFKNTMIPLVTMLAGILPGLFGGAMITEQVFALPGIGQKAYQALVDGDVPFIMGYNMFLSVLAVIGILATDLMYMLVDPRVKVTK